MAASPTKWPPEKESELSEKLQLLATAISASPTTWGETSTSATAFQSLVDIFVSTITSSANATAAAKAETQTKYAARSAATDRLRQIAKKIQANPAITPSMKASVGLPMQDSTRSPVPVFAPSNLVATGTSTGAVGLKWKRNGNTYGATYLIESRAGLEGPWTLVATTTKTDFIQFGQPVGVPQYYRVSAQRASGTSQPSNVAIAWADSLPESVSLKLAA